jgi:aminopeptidase N
MDGWIFTGGFPQVSVGGGGGSYTVRQEQFRYLEPGASRWKIPMLVRSDDGVARVLLEDEETTIEAGSGLVVNAGGDGFYRVRYSPELLADLRSRLDELDGTERYALVSDTWASVLTGETAAAEFVALVGAMGDETESDVWGAMLAGLGELDRIVSSDTRPVLQRFTSDLVSDAADSLGWVPQPGESDRTRELRGLLIKGRGVLGDDQETQRTASDVWRRYREGEAFDAEVRDAALSVVAANGTVDDFKVFIDQSDGATNPQDVVKYLRAATAVPEADAAEKLFQMVLDGDVRSQDSMWVLALLLGHRENGPRIWQLIKANWDATLAAMPPQNKQRMLDLLHFRSEPAVAADIEAFLAEHPIPAGQKFTSQQIELMKVRVGLRARETDRLGEAFD